MHRVSYDEAMAKPSLRQAYLDSLGWERVMPWVGSVRYNISQLEGEGRMYVDTRAFQKSQGTNSMDTKNPKVQFAPIHVNPKAFHEEVYPFEDDFLCALIHHEGYHAREMHYAGDFFWKMPTNSSFSNKHLHMLLCEYRAYSNEYLHLKPENSELYVKEITQILDLIPLIIREHVTEKEAQQLLLEHKPLW